jgi:cell division inhibitor SepF
MSTMRKMAVYLGLVEDDADYQDDELDYDDQRTSYAQPRSSYSSSPAPSSRPEPRPTSSSVRTLDPRSGEPRPSSIDTRSYSSTSAVAREVVFDNEVEPMGAGDAYRITTLHPRSYNDARRIGEEFRENVPVIMNLTEMDDTDAKRIVDFAAGLVFGLRGTIERVTNKVFLLSPANVDVAAEARKLAQDGFFNQS